MRKLLFESLIRPPLTERPPSLADAALIEALQGPPRAARSLAPGRPGPQASSLPAAFQC